MPVYENACADSCCRRSTLGIFSGSAAGRDSAACGWAAPAPQYQIVIDTMAASLVIKVNELMATGWQPAGGVTTSNSGRPDAPLVTYYQAMIRTGAVMKLK